MAGLTDEGFTVLTLPEIVSRMETRLKVYDPEIDLDIASPDGQNVSIFSYEVSQLWQQLNLVHLSGDPRVASGQGLRNIGLLTGQPYGFADRSVVDVLLAGTTNTLVPKGSILADVDGNEFQTTSDAIIPSGVQAISIAAGTLPVPVGTVVVVKTVIAGFDTVTQPTEGVQGRGTQTAQQYRTLRNQTVMRNGTSVTDKVSAQLYDLGLEQASVVDNDHPTDPAADGTPAMTLHVIIGDVGSVTDQEIALAILKSKGIGTPTWSLSNFSVLVDDNQGIEHEIFFDKATAVPVVAEVNLTYLSNDIAGASESIKNDMCDRINNLLAGEDVIWSHLFSDITRYGEAQVNSLELGRTIPGLASGNLAITTYEYATCTPDDINIVVV
jgi:uncharacterized phage protein gp47/JayE